MHSYACLFSPSRFDIYCWRSPGCLFSTASLADFHSSRLKFVHGEN
uniref:Uncharacterized protein n=1 Tax=Anguilla anguilla TaxID=7936 RepID=A0A0E9S9T4_ANGAN